MNTGNTESSRRSLFGALRTELPLLAGALTTAAFAVFADAWLAELSFSFGSGLLFAWIFAAMLWCA